MKIVWKWWADPVFWVCNLPILRNSKTVDRMQRALLFRYGFTVVFNGREHDDE